jgi:peroxiredoxin
MGYTREYQMAISNVSGLIGMSAPDFRLPATDGKSYGLADIAGEKGTVIAFICNHCPYVKAVAGRMAADARTLMGAGVGFAAICSNDATSHPADSFDNMKIFAAEHGFAFPYLQDEDQTVARAYDAACTPEFYGFDRDGKLVYHGRLDEGRTAPIAEGARRELVEAMMAVAEGLPVPADPVPAMGCSIKWKQAS